MDNLKDIREVPEATVADLPFEGDIVCKRDNYGTHFNISQEFVYHSPTGMEWGYGGSGPSDFALNVLLKFTNLDTAKRLHNDFKWKFIATLPREGGTIEGEKIRDYILKAAR